MRALPPSSGPPYFALSTPQSMTPPLPLQRDIPLLFHPSLSEIDIASTRLALIDQWQP
jgi:hypothetical protein